MNNPNPSLASLLLLALAACNQAEPPQPAVAGSAAVTEQVPAEVLNAPSAPQDVNGTAVDVCALLDAASAAQSAGTLFKPPEAQQAQGSLLGGCNYLGDKGIVMLTARPAAEFQATVNYAAKKGGAKPITDLPGSASMTSVGLMLLPEGKPYFLVVYPLIGGSFNEAAALQLARQLKH